MTGHGSPKSNRFDATVAGPLGAGRRCAIAAAALLWLGMLPVSAARAAEEDQTIVDLNLRIQLICDAPQVIEGEIVVGQGRVSEIQNLSMDAGTTGGFWTIDQGRGVRIHPRSATDRLGFDLHYVGPRTDRLTARLKASTPSSPMPGGGEQVVEVPIDIASLLEKDFDTLVAGGIRLWVSRPASDAMRIRLGGGQAMIFAAGEQVPVRVSASAIRDVPARPLELRLAIQNAASGHAEWQKTMSITAEQLDRMREGVVTDVDVGTVALPDAEGVYALTAKLVPAPGLRLVDRLVRPDLFMADEAIAQRRVQFVVLEPLPPPVDPTPMAPIARLNLFDRGWLGFGSTGQVASAPLGRSTVDGQPVALLAPDSHVALKIPIDGIGKPHVLAIRYPRDQMVKMAISIRQADATGRLATMGIDSAVADESVGEGYASDDDLGGEHRIVFWPRVSEPVMVLTNPDARTVLKIESITVEAGPERLAGGVSPSGEGRLAAIYLDKSLITEAFSCVRASDPASGIALDDWNTFLQAGRRLVDYVQYCGANGAVVTVLGEGGALYPAPQLTPTPRYDTGVFFSDGRDPVRKDVLELMLRLFDRSGLRLVPSIELATPLTALEQQLEDPESAIGLEYVDSAGRRYVDGHPPRHGLAPYYNVLDPRVEQQIAMILEDLRTRYAHHRSFAAAGIHLGPQTFLQLPPPAWGRDPRTLERLRQDWDAALRMSGKVAARVPTASLNAWIDNEAMDQFVGWRADELTELYRRLASHIAGHPLVLMTADYLPPQPDTPGGGAIQCGLDWSTLAQIPGIVPLRAIRERLLVEPARRIEDAKMNEDLAWDQALHGIASTADSAAPRSRTAGGLIFRPPAERPLTLPPGLVGPGDGAREIMLYAQAVPGGSAYVRQLSRPLHGFDAQMIAVGGWMPGFGQERLGRDFFTTFSSLPRGSFVNVQPIDGAASVVKVRQQQTATGLVFYAVNTAPWDMRVEIGIDAPAGAPLRPLGQDRSASAKPHAPAPAAGRGAPAWTGFLRPGELVAFEVPAPCGGVALWGATPRQPEQLVKLLAQRVEDLNTRVAVLGRPRRFDVLVGGGFESGDENQITGWLRAQHPPTCVRFDASRVEGKRSVVLSGDSSQGSRTWLLSEPLPTSETGRMAVSLMVRRVSGSPRVRVAVEGRNRGTAVRHSIEIDLPDDNDWPTEPHWLRVSDLPSGEIQDLRIAIDLLTPGEIAIDDVRLYDFFLTDRERSELQRQTFVALERLRRGDFAAAARLLDSHWARYLRWLRVPAVSGDGATEGVPPAETDLSNRSPERAEESAPGVAERLRNWLPEPLRF